MPLVSGPFVTINIIYLKMLLNEATRQVCLSLRWAQSHCLCLQVSDSPGFYRCGEADANNTVQTAE